MIKQKKNLFDEQKNKFLDFRREKLSNLLKSEELRYKQEIIENQETPEQVRLKMENKLIALKEQREKERHALVTEKLRKKFFDGSDDLRKNDSEAFTFSCYLEQENQMLEKLAKREKERENEEVYLRLLNFQREIEDNKERKRLEARMKLKQDTYNQLQWQNEQNRLAAEKEKELKKYEISKLKEQWEKDVQIEKEEKEAVLATNKQVYKDIEEFNRREEFIRSKRSSIEKMVCILF
jgi:hypothetical protein